MQVQPIVLSDTGKAKVKVSRKPVRPGSTIKKK